MADNDVVSESDVKQHLLRLMVKQDYAPALLNLAEAYAWLERPGQPHGGTVEVKS